MSRTVYSEFDAERIVLVGAFALGQRVKILDGDCTGKIVDHTRYLDGSERFGVEYWHNGERKSIGCRADELEACE